MRTGQFCFINLNGPLKGPGGTKKAAELCGGYLVGLYRFMQHSSETRAPNEKYGLCMCVCVYGHEYVYIFRCINV